MKAGLLRVKGDGLRAEEVYELIKREKIVAICRGVAKETILDVAEALYKGGIKLLEITCNQPDAFDMIKLLTSRMAGRQIIGAGTVITCRLCDDVLAAGTEYVIAPDVNAEVIERCVKSDAAVIPGAATATEILTAGRLGAKMVKIFPAAALGTDYIKMLKGPIDNIDFVAVGGVRLKNITDFLAAGCVAVGLGSTVIDKKFIEKCQWEKLTLQTAEYVEKVKTV